MTTHPNALSTRWQPALRLAAAAAVMSLVAACGGAAATDSVERPENSGQATFPAVQVQPATLRVGDGVPLTKEPILAIRGKISGANDGDALQLGTDTLDQFGLLQVRLYEPWAKKRMSFQGMWLADLLDVAGVDASARGVHLVALDDFQVDLTSEVIAAGGIFLATKTYDGSPIPIDQGGPTRIVFMDGVKAGASADQWIWSLKDISVR
jgi:hypothetical protein